MEIINFADAQDSQILSTIRQRCSGRKLRWTNHILIRLFQRGISIDDVTAALLSGEIIERYPKDYPHPSYLVLGLTSTSKMLHVVCGIGPDEFYLITAYYPDPDQWEANGKIRKDVSS